MGRGPVGAPAIIRYVNNSLASVDDVSGIDDSMVLIKTLTASSSDDLTFVKHFRSRVSNYEGSDYAMEAYVAGYCNVTAAIDGVQFKFDSGDIDAGTFKLYGVV